MWNPKSTTDILLSSELGEQGNPKVLQVALFAEGHGQPFSLVIGIATCRMIWCKEFNLSRQKYLLKRVKFYHEMFSIM